ncbi:MAG: SDR family oxidoreductase [Phycisphaerae bacterium]|jgi:NAD(P)-dependent dehydrogenase (short-subunit alcohol dehydrogenase family)
MQLEGRVALVTGAARRVGRAIAVMLAAEKCRVAIHHRGSAADAEEAAAACRQAGAEAAIFQADFVHEPQTRQLARDVLSRFGRVDILVNNAAVFEPDSIDSFEPGRWERTLRVNLTAPLLLAWELREVLRAARGRIVNLCDAAADRTWTDYLSYCVSKGALDSLTRALARALAPEVNVVGVAPGVAAWPESFDAALRKKITARIPLARAGTPQDVASAVRYLLKHGDYVTGVVLPVDGGRRLV